MRYRLLAAGAAIVLILAGLATAGQSRTFNVATSLKASTEVPKPVGVRAGAAGKFTGTAVELANTRSRLAWKLTFTKLTGRAMAAHIHIGRVGKAGNVMVALCGPCKSGQRGTKTITRAQLGTIRAGRAYVNVHTAKNPAGEIRGQLKATLVSSDGSPPPPPPPPAPEPPPPPPPPYP
ncbi:MAG TPA: CHRD domain-containing protein [Gaiellaceae bacterium]|nr:CHRD domain-containing protein [Gaiellaceae bacterium]